MIPGALRWDINCDLGEEESPRRTAALFACITSANVACGGHAGDVASMQRCAELAVRHGVRLGAHPGLAGGFGRQSVNLAPEAFAELVRIQILELRSAIASINCPVHHVKLHGALYHLSESGPEHARAYLETVRRLDPALRVYALAGGRVVALAPTLGIVAWPEAYLDRGYHGDGRLVPRGDAQALLTFRQVMQRWQVFLREGKWQATDGSWICQPTRTWCLHGDGPDAVRIARTIRRHVTYIGYTSRLRDGQIRKL